MDRTIIAGEQGPVVTPPEDKQPKRDGARLDGAAGTLGLPVARLRRYSTVMAAIARRGLSDEQHVDDIVHSAFVVACAKEKSARPDPEDDRGWLAWLCDIVDKLVLNQNRKRREDPIAYDELEPLAGVEQPSLSYEDKRTAQAAFDALPPEQRKLLDEHFLEGKSITLIAEERGKPYTTTYARVQGALREARAFVEADPRSPKRGRRGAMLFPFLLFWLIPRAARAQFSAAWAQLTATVARSPMRVLCGVATGAAVLGSAPTDVPRAMEHGSDETQAQAHTVTTGAVAPPVQACLRAEPRGTAMSTGRSEPQGKASKPASAGRRSPSPYVDRSLDGIVDANALRYGK